MADSEEYTDGQRLGVWDAIKEITDTVRDITDTGKQKALAKFIRLMSRENTQGWSEEKYFDAWKVFQVSEKLDRVEAAQRSNHSWSKNWFIKIWAWFKASLKHAAETADKIRIE